MEPTLREGDVVFVDTRPSTAASHRDLDVIVARHPQQNDVEIIKRIEFLDDGAMFLRSDNADDPNAADSRRFGMVPASNFVGLVVAKL